MTVHERSWSMWWRLPDVDPDYEPAKLRDIQLRLLDEDTHRWLPVVNPAWNDPARRDPARRPRGRHRR